MKGTAAGAVALMLVSASAIGSPYKCFHADGSVSYSDRATSAQECVSLDRGERERESLAGMARAMSLQLRAHTGMIRACNDAVAERGHQALLDERYCVLWRESEEEVLGVLHRIQALPEGTMTRAQVYAVEDLGAASRTLGRTIELTAP